MKKGIMRGKMTPANNIVVKHFGYEVGKSGTAKFGFIATLKHEDNTFDPAMCMQDLNFKLAPGKILHKKKSTLVGITTSQLTWIEYVETSFSQDQKEQLQAYIQARLLKTFNEHYSHLTVGKHQPQLSFCNADEHDCH